ncbi:hypothetical protein DMUE_3479 [Dictyocoela muelleri]|nr:hypothetical protein DMUE_3479 [Dictyocoela muelleri]
MLGFNQFFYFLIIVKKINLSQKKIKNLSIDNDAHEYPEYINLACRDKIVVLYQDFYNKYTLFDEFLKKIFELKKGTTLTIIEEQFDGSLIEKLQMLMLNKKNIEISTNDFFDLIKLLSKYNPKKEFKENICVSLISTGLKEYKIDKIMTISIEKSQPTVYGYENKINLWKYVFEVFMSIFEIKYKIIGGILYITGDENDLREYSHVDENYSDNLTGILIYGSIFCNNSVITHLNYFSKLLRLLIFSIFTDKIFGDKMRILIIKGWFSCDAFFSIINIFNITPIFYKIEHVRIEKFNYYSPVILSDGRNIFDVFISNFPCLTKLSFNNSGSHINYTHEEWLKSHLVKCRLTDLFVIQHDDSSENFKKLIRNLFLLNKLNIKNVKIRNPHEFFDNVGFKYSLKSLEIGKDTEFLDLISNYPFFDFFNLESLILNNENMPEYQLRIILSDKKLQRSLKSLKIANKNKFSANFGEYIGKFTSLEKLELLISSQNINFWISIFTSTCLQKTLTELYTNKHENIYLATENNLVKFKKLALSFIN